MSAYPYQYVVLRYVPRVDRGECLNVGVVLFSQAADYLACAHALDPERVRAFDPGTDLQGLTRALEAITDLCTSPPTAVDEVKPLGKRFGWISAPRSTVLQPGPIHGGISADPAVTLEGLVDRLVR